MTSLFRARAALTGWLGLLVVACDPDDFARRGAPGDAASLAAAAGDAESSERARPTPMDAAPPRHGQAGDARSEADAQLDASAAEASSDGSEAPHGEAGRPDAGEREGGLLDAGPPCFRAAPLLGLFQLDGSALDSVPSELGGALSVKAQDARFTAGRLREALGMGELVVDNPRLGALDALTITAWLRLDQVSVERNTAFVWKGDESGHDYSSGYWLVLAGPSFRAENAQYLEGVTGQGHLGFGLTSESEEQLLFTSAPFPIGRYVHVVASFDGVRARLYLDGRIERDVEQRVAVRTTSTPLRLGSALHGTLSPLAGALDEVALIGRALAPHEVAELYALSGQLCAP